MGGQHHRRKQLERVKCSSSVVGRGLAAFRRRNSSVRFSGDIRGRARCLRSASTAACSHRNAARFWLVGMNARRLTSSTGCRGRAQVCCFGATITMQSTGQGATHSSHPVQNSMSTVCICWRAPRMASNGHGGRQRAQPMHRSSSICATSADHLTFMPGCAPESGDSRNAPISSPEAASTMPSDTPNFILRGARFATITIRRPLRVSGS